ncbi:accessory Sec system protein translocase subunit SecY2 [Aerococcus sanguinicola]|uniref:accessory Sec system protein translocase subunit SecY2 n=1 Tax=unclassified Aerococcus TaxID=2618060 RepID=UPI000AEBBC1E|nr:MULTISPECIES: accessory Sec system protein translocase subunit SecY2 [unclassified Aerococcus]MDK6233991.1 accessory Sec system protein translocase subunit SecY2 [Aerococcus sp. UMB10185]MDK6856539.1 accessory Sec system protein translocase subunit SecY2 [Aerococcus sp. UMB7533]MDK8502053.1 accessory Sec system protein translocase subunit SecY2 [Aerococcus sp. UMB1112A]
MSRLQRIFHLSLLQEKILFTALILIILIIGKTLPLPLVDLATFNEQIQADDFLSVALSVTGGDLERVSLFTLGIGPYMSTMIIWRFIAMSKWYKKLKVPVKRETIYRNLLTLVIGIIQALSLVLSYPLIDKASLTEGWSRLILIIFLLAGTFYLIWLGNKNSQYGIGGPTIIILSNMLLRIPRNFGGLRTYFTGVASQTELYLLAFILFFSVFTMLTTVLMERGERRIPLNRVMINNDFAEKSYLPIKANPSGGMAIMYAMTLAALPRYILQLILVFNPQAAWAQDLIVKLNTTHPLGAAFYLLMIILLSLGFAFVNVDPEDLAENLQKTGDYISGLNPGQETSNYLQRKILNMAILGTIYMTFIVGLPLILGLIFPEYARLFGMSSSVLILFSLFIMIIDEIKALSLREKYKPLFE